MLSVLLSFLLCFFFCFCTINVHDLSLLPPVRTSPSSTRPHFPCFPLPPIPLALSRAIFPLLSSLPFPFLSSFSFPYLPSQFQSQSVCNSQFHITFTKSFLPFSRNNENIKKIKYLPQCLLLFSFTAEFVCSMTTRICVGYSRTRTCFLLYVFSLRLFFFLCVCVHARCSYFLVPARTLGHLSSRTNPQVQCHCTVTQSIFRVAFILCVRPLLVCERPFLSPFIPLHTYSISAKLINQQPTPRGINQLVHQPKQQPKLTSTNKQTKRCQP